MNNYKCHWCQYRHSDCDHREPIPNCSDFRVGGCYSCKYYHGVNGKLNDKETDNWFRRGCETYFPSSLRCDKRKRISRKRKKRLQKKGLWRG